MTQVQFFFLTENLISGTTQTLKRLQLAIDAKQKDFVAHPSVQQLLGAIWYDGLPGFRRLHIIRYVCVSFVYFIAAVCLHFCLHEFFFLTDNYYVL